MEDAEMVEAPEQQDDGGDITMLAKKIGNDLAQFSEKLNGSQAVTDQDREKMAGVLNGFIDLVENGLGAAPGADPEAEEPAVDAAVSPEAGLKGVPMGPNTRM